MLIPLVIALVSAAPADGPAAHDSDRAALRTWLSKSIAAGPRGAAVALPDGPSEAVRQWLRANRAALDGVGPGGLAEQPWGLVGAQTAGQNGTTRFLYVFEWHASGSLVVYGLTGGVAHASLLSDPAGAALPVATVGQGTVITVPKQAPDPLACVVVLKLRGEPETADLAARPAEDGRITLHARDAVVHGRTVRYEPQPHKNTIGYWSDPKDWVSWQFGVTRPGKYRAEILQGCGKGSGGSKVDFAVGDQVLNVVVEDTGGFQNFIARDVGVYHFAKPGRYTLSVKPTHKPGVAVMDLREVTLIPGDERR